MVGEIVLDSVGTCLFGGNRSEGRPVVLCVVLVERPVPVQMMMRI